MFGAKKRRAKKEQKELEGRKATERALAATDPAATDPGEPSVATGNGGSVAAVPVPDRAVEPETEIRMRQELQEALGRPVILIKEKRRDWVWHTAIKHQRVATGLGLLGLGIATGLTHGVALVIVTSCSAGIPLLDVNTFFDKKKDAYNKAVILDQAAIDALLNIRAPERAGITQVAIDVRGSVDGRVRLTGADIEVAQAALATKQAALDTAADSAIAARQSALDTVAGPGPVQIGVRMGLAVVGSGILLLAFTIIPADIHTLMTRVASLILVVGVLIIGGALANGSWLKGRD